MILVIILNNEHNEPTQGDIGETSNEPTQATRNEFEELYSSANEALYPGCGHVTRLDFMTKFTFFKVRKSIHACEHDCCLFRGEVNKDLQFCPVYNTSRWKDSDTPGKKVPRKVLRYFPIIPRLQRLYKSRHTAKDMIWHATGKCTEPGKMQHPVDGGAWKKFDMKYPDLQNRTRNVRLRVVCDGSIVQQTLVRRYSMWPVLLTITICIRGFMQTRKRFLRKLHKWRSSREFNGDTDHRDPPKEYPRDVILAQHARCLSRSVCNTIGLRSFPPFRAKEFNKARWYVLHNSPEIDTYRAQSRGCVVRVKWFDTRNNGRVKKLTFRNRMTQIIDSGEWGCHRGREQPDLYIWINNPDLPPSIRGEEWIMSPSYDLHYRGESRRRIMMLKDLINDDDGAQFGKSYNTNKATLKREHWIRDPETGAYDLDRIRWGKPDEYTDDEWEKYINFWNDPANAQRAETNRLNPSEQWRRQPKRNLQRSTRSIVCTLLTVYSKILRLSGWSSRRTVQKLCEQHGEINATVRGGKLRGHIPGVGPVLPGYVRSRLSYSAPVDRSNDVDFMMSLMRSDDRFADAFARYDSGGASGSGGSRARDSEGGEDGDDTGREDGGDDTNFSPATCRWGKGTVNDKIVVVQALTSQRISKLPQRHVAGETPAKRQNSRVRSFPSDMSLGNLVPPWHQFLDQKLRGAHFSLGIVAGERFVIELTPSMFPQRHVAGDRFPQRHVAGEGVRMLLGKGLITVIGDVGGEKSEVDIFAGKNCKNRGKKI
ncbi:hypothetical protein Tco_1407445 [Tanacetum coccineum]